MQMIRSRAIRCKISVAVRALSGTLDLYKGWGKWPTDVQREL